MARRSSSLGRETLAFVLAGGRGSRIREMTNNRCKPAVHFGGKMRIIDFALSNAVNSNIRKIALATQYKSHSLIRHCHSTWNFMQRDRDEVFDILPASQRILVLSRLRSGLSTHLCGLSFECQGAFATQR